MSVQELDKLLLKAHPAMMESLVLNITLDFTVC